MSQTHRDLDWDGCINVRDLGGIPIRDGRAIRWGAVVRADSLDRLTPNGWAALMAHGVRTIVDLRNDDEVGDPTRLRPQKLTTVRVPLDDIGDSAFWDDWVTGPQFGTPLYYGPFMARKQGRCAAAVAAVANAGPGGVAVHCGGGRDRTGLVTLLLLALVGVEADDIASDYELSYERMRPFYPESGEDDPEAFLMSRGTSARASILDLLASIDVEDHLRRGGLRDEHLTALRGRLLEPDGAG